MNKKVIIGIIAVITIIAIIVYTSDDLDWIDSC